MEQELSLRQVDFFCFHFFQCVVKLQKLVIDDLVSDNIDGAHFENFLMTLPDLNDLKLRKLRGNHIFKTGQLSAPAGVGVAKLSLLGCGGGSDVILPESIQSQNLPLGAQKLILRAMG